MLPSLPGHSCERALYFYMRLLPGYFKSGIKEFSGFGKGVIILRHFNLYLAKKKTKVKFKGY